MQLYQHTNFIYAGTLKTSKDQQVPKEEYNWQHQEIVMPVYSPCSEYLVMHTPSVFNWLRKNGISQDRINRYLKGEKPFAGIQKPLLHKIKGLSEQWQIVRLCFTAKFYISKTYSQSCQHLTKRNINTIEYYYNYPNKEITLEKYHCGNCNETVKVEAIIKRHPHVLMLQRFQDKVFLNKSEYKLYLAIVNAEKNQVFVKIASGAWYYVEAGGTRIKTQAQVKQTKCQYYFYHQVMAQTNKSTLTIAKPAIRQVPNRQQPQPVAHIQQEQVDKIVQKSKDSDSKTYKLKIFKTDLRPLKQQIYHPMTYSNDSGYEKLVQKLYAKEKQKDKYDVQYDIGKVKKVKKKKFIHKIDFNETQKEIRSGNIKPIRFKNKFRGANLDKQ